MSFEIKALKPQDLETLYEFEKSRHTNLNEIEKTFLEWKAPWRKESLEHYLKASWCMGLYDDATKEFVGYFLAQPLLFVESYTQTLWVEHIGFKNIKIAEELLDVVYKYARDKHLQRVLFNNLEILKEVKPKFQWVTTQKGFFEVYTTKMSTL